MRMRTLSDWALARFAHDFGLRRTNPRQVAGSLTKTPPVSNWTLARIAPDCGLRRTNPRQAAVSLTRTLRLRNWAMARFATGCGRRRTNPRQTAGSLTRMPRSSNWRFARFFCLWTGWRCALRCGLPSLQDVADPSPLRTTDWQCVVSSSGMGCDWPAVIGFCPMDWRSVLWDWVCRKVSLTMCACDDHGPGTTDHGPRTTDHGRLR
jgi:hypothetical protein